MDNALIGNPDADYVQRELQALLELTQRSDPRDSQSEGHTITLQNVRIDFPVKPYPAQIQMMTKIVQALNKGENALLESPTGSGKSLALLCSVLAWKEQQSRLATEKIISEKSVITHKLPEIKSQEISNELIKQFIDAISEPKREKKSDRKYARSGTIYVASRTHRQLSQLISELRSKTRYRPRTAVLGSREHLCINPKMKKVANKTEGCRKLLDEGKCHYFRGTKKMLQHTKLRDTIWDIEDIVQEAKGCNGCAYYASRNLYEGAEVIFCPYNYIIDPTIRKTMEIDLSDSIIILDEAHNIEDASRSAGSYEITKDEFDIIINELDLVTKYSGLPQPHAVLKDMVVSLSSLATSPDIQYMTRDREEHSSHFSGQALLEKLYSVGINQANYQNLFKPAYFSADKHAEKIRKKREQIQIEVENQPDSQDPQGAKKPKMMGVSCLSTGSLNYLQKILFVLEFLFDPKHNYANDYELVLMKTINSAVYWRKRKRTVADDEDLPGTWSQKLGFWCLDPGIIFKNMCDKTRSVILTSGTLSPLNTFASELDTKFEGRLEANHVISPSQVWVRAIPHGPSHYALKGNYQNFESHHYQDEVGQTICDIVNTVPYGILCFMPSYKAINTLLARWKATGLLNLIESRKTVLKEPKGSSKSAFEKILKRYYRIISEVEQNETQDTLDGVIMFAVYRGKVSEGIDFSDNYCRAVIALGIPYPSFKDLQVVLKREYNNKIQMQGRKKSVLSGSDWYNAQAFRAINQALGRCIRHKNDWGAIILLEERFRNFDYVNGLSKWVKGYFQFDYEYNASMLSLNEFIDNQLGEEEKLFLEKRRTKVKNELEEDDSEDLSILVDDTDVVQVKVESDCDVIDLTDINNNISTPVNDADLDDFKPANDSNSWQTDTMIHDEKIIDTQQLNDSASGHGNKDDMSNDSKDTSNDTLVSNGSYIDCSAELAVAKACLIDPECDLLDTEISFSNSHDGEVNATSKDKDTSSDALVSNDCSAELAAAKACLIDPECDLIDTEELLFSNSHGGEVNATSKDKDASSDTLVSNGSYIDCFAEPTKPKTQIGDHACNPIDIEVLCKKCKKRLFLARALDVTHSISNLKCLEMEGEWVMSLKNLYSFEFAGNLVDEELDINKLPKNNSVIYDHEEEICYKTVACKCDKENPIGLFVCAATSDKNRWRVGSMYLLQTKAYREHYIDWDSYSQADKEKLMHVLLEEQEYDYEDDYEDDYSLL